MLLLALFSVDEKVILFFFLFNDIMFLLLSFFTILIKFIFLWELLLNKEDEL